MATARDVDEQTNLGQRPPHRAVGQARNCTRELGRGGLGRRRVRAARRGFSSFTLGRIGAQDKVQDGTSLTEPGVCRQMIRARIHSFHTVPLANRNCGRKCTPGADRARSLAGGRRPQLRYVCRLSPARETKSARRRDLIKREGLPQLLGSPFGRGVGGAGRVGCAGLLPRETLAAVAGPLAMTKRQ